MIIIIPLLSTRPVATYSKLRLQKNKSTNFKFLLEKCSVAVLSQKTQLRMKEQCLNHNSLSESLYENDVKKKILRRCFLLSPPKLLRSPSECEDA